MNITNITYFNNLSSNPCAYIKDFHETINIKYKASIIVLVIIHLTQLLVLEIYDRKKNKELSDAQIVINFMQLSSYVKLISVLFLLMSAFSL